jgi:hypothetical protein
MAQRKGPSPNKPFGAGAVTVTFGGALAAGVFFGAWLPFIALAGASVLLSAAPAILSPNNKKK